MVRFNNFDLILYSVFFLKACGKLVVFLERGEAVFVLRRGMALLFQLLYSFTVNQRQGFVGTYGGKAAMA